MVLDLLKPFFRSNPSFGLKYTIFSAANAVSFCGFSVRPHLDTLGMDPADCPLLVHRVKPVALAIVRVLELVSTYNPLPQQYTHVGQRYGHSLQ
jgi:hypothetical protein